MFTYRCPSCGKQHVVDSSFAHEYAAPCLRCRQVIHVTAELVHGATATTPAGKRWGGKASAVLSHSIQSAETLAHQATAGSSDGEMSARENVDDPGAVEKGQEHDWADRPANPSNPEAAGKQKQAKEPDDEADAAKKKKRKSSPEPEAPLAKGRRSWLVITGIAAAVLALLATGGYFGYDYYRKNKGGQKTALAKESSKTDSKASKTSKSGSKTVAAANTKTSSKTAPADKGKTASSAANTSKEKSDPKKLEKEKPILQPRDDKLIRLTAARLSTELELDPEGTNQKYKGALLEVTGVFNKIEIRESGKIKSPHVLFACSGPVISCDMLGGPTDVKQLSVLRRALPYTFRGVYDRDGVLRTCELRPVSPPADQEFKDKELEVVGYAARIYVADRVTPFPRIHLENETNGLTVVECMFRKSDEAKVLAVTEDAPIIVRGVCAGRYEELGVDTRRIRLNNCELVLTSAPMNQVRRVHAIQLTRAYDEDLRTTLVPLQDERLEGVIPVAKLEAEFKADAKAFERKYRFKTFVVTGVRVDAGGLVLTTGNTDAVLKIRCQFTKRTLKDLDPVSTPVIEGFCSGIADKHYLVLENCEGLDENAQRIAQRLTAEFCPHTPGQVRTYDIAQFPIGTDRPSTLRVQIDYKEDGLIQTMITYVNQSQPVKIFDPADSKWTTFRSTKKLRLPGPDLRLRVYGGYVQLGQYQAVGKSGTELYFEPILKLGARPGDTWSWTHDHYTYEYKLVKFDTYRGLPSAIIEETITKAGDPHHPRELRIVYARGLGEVERRDYLRVAVTERRLLLERRLVEDQQASAEPSKKEETRSAAGNRGN